MVSQSEAIGAAARMGESSQLVKNPVITNYGY
jgi:hypothetical protein